MNPASFKLQTVCFIFKNGPDISAEMHVGSEDDWTWPSGQQNGLYTALMVLLTCTWKLTCS